MHTGTTLRVHHDGMLEYRRKGLPWHFWKPVTADWDWAWECQLVIPLPKGDRLEIHSVSKTGDHIRVTVTMSCYYEEYGGAWYPQDTFRIVPPECGYIDIRC